MTAQSDDQPVGYFSKSMQDRRRRIIAATIELIEKEGIANLSLTEVCKQAGVARRTIYYAFETRDALISAAVQEQFERLEQGIKYEHEVGSLARVVERTCFAAERNLRYANYAGAVITLYFSRDTSKQLFAKLRRQSTNTHSEWIHRLHSFRQLQPWVDPMQLEGDVTQIRFAIAHQWLQGMIESEALANRMIVPVLTYVSGSVRGAARKQLDEAIQLIERHGARGYLLHVREKAGARAEVGSDRTAPTVAT